MPPTLLIIGSSLGAAYLLERYAFGIAADRSRLAVAAGFATLQVLAWIVWRAVLYPKLFSPLRNLPHPPNGGFFMGQAGEIFALPSGEPMRRWISTVPNDGLIRYLHWFNIERLLLTNPKTLAEVLSAKNYEFIKPPHFQTVLSRILGVGVLLAEGDEHKIQRKNLMPAFAFRHVKDLYPTFWGKSQEMIEGISAAISEANDTKDANVVEVSDWLSRATLDIIGVAGMGQDFGALKDPHNKLSATYKSVFNPPRSARYMQMAGMFIPHSFLSALPIKRNGELEAASAHIKQTCRDLIKAKKIDMEKGERTGVDILSVALESGGFGDENLVSQMMTFLAAGHETTSSSSQWALYLLCKHPEVQSKLRREIHEKLPSPRKQGSQITTAELDACHYLQAFCNEVLRFMPPVAITMRIASEDATIQGQFVPKGTTIVLCPYAVNASPELWGSDATEFNPDRWMAPGQAGKGGAESNYSFLTFLRGPRSCIGETFAKAEFACLIAAFVGRFEAEFKDPGYIAEVKRGITSKPKGGLHLRLKEIEQW